MSSPRTTREALIAELLGDVDILLARIEALPALVARAEDNLSSTTKSLLDAGDKYRMAVTAFTEQAKFDLSEYLDAKTNHVALMVSKTVEEQRAALQEIAHATSQQKTSNVNSASHGTNKELSSSRQYRLAELTLVAMFASILTACFVYLIFK